MRPTEQSAADVAGLDQWDSVRILEILLHGQRRALDAVEHALPSIAAAADAIGPRLAGGGRLVYAGAGSSIRIGVQDGSELPATFGLPENQIAYLIAGGRAAMFDTLAEAEDDEAAARRDAANLGLGPRDTVLAIAASGATPYTLAAARAARQAGAFVIAIANNAGAPLSALADLEVLLESGPEVIAGSTRMGAGTAQKAALNLLSTLVNVRRGAVHDGHMVGVIAGNGKLRARAARIVAAIAGTGESAAAAALDLAHGDVKTAVLISARGLAPGAAAAALASAEGNLRKALQGRDPPA
jgi:N-acetylmuramic acid 6-phosphate etherase